MNVFDERCVTKYPAKCVKEQQCTMLYQTVCNNAGYQQKCRKEPKQSCNPVTKCHRTPKTKCRPTKDKECSIVTVNVPFKEERTRCLPFGPKATPNLSACSNPSGTVTGSRPNNSGAPSTGLRLPTQAPTVSAPPPPPPARPSYNSQPTNPIGHTNLVLTPNSAAPTITNTVSSNQDSYGSPQASPIGTNSVQSFPNTVTNTVPNNQDSYGSPQASPIGTNSVQTFPSTSVNSGSINTGSYSSSQGSGSITSLLSSHPREFGEKG